MKNSKPLNWVEMKTQMVCTSAEWDRIWIPQTNSFVKYKSPSLFAIKLQHIKNCGCLFAAKANNVYGKKRYERVQYPDKLQTLQ